MKIENYQFPKSSFLSLEKDSQIIISKILKNENLKKLLYYPSKNCYSMPNLTQEQTLSLINNQIKISPLVKIDKDIISYLILSYDKFSPNISNPEFRDNFIIFDIICHNDQWNLGDFKLRPYKIAGEIDSMFDNSKLTGIGKLNFVGGDQIILNNEYSGLSLIYLATHGEEDKK